MFYALFGELTGMGLSGEDSWIMVCPRDPETCLDSEEPAESKQKAAGEKKAEESALMGKIANA